MTAIQKLYIKMFLLTGLPFGVLMVLPDLVNSRLIEWWLFPVYVLGFGLAMSLLLVTAHLKSVQSLGYSMQDDAAQHPNQEKRIHTPLSLDAITNRVIETDWIDKIRAGDDDTILTLLTKPTWRSFGELINIKSIATADGIHTYEISSKPNARTTVIDFGKNIMNLQRIEALMDASNGDL